MTVVLPVTQRIYSRLELNSVEPEFILSCLILCEHT